LIRRVSGASVSEIEKLIAELQSLRDHLLEEGQRIQREITGYARLNQGAVDAARVHNRKLAEVESGT